MRTILITGVSKGIGLTLTEHLLKKGFSVIGLGRSAPQEINNPNFSFIQCDLLNFEELKSTLKILDTKPIDFFIHNAMYTPKHAPFIKYNAEDFMNAHALSTVAPTLIIQKIGMGMKKRGYGKILFLGSIIQITGSAGQLPYLTAKSGLSGLVKGLALELGKYGITTNLFLLGAVNTEKIRDNLGEEKMKLLADQLTHKRFIETIEIAITLEGFLSTENSIINGSEILLSNAQHLRSTN